MTDTSDYFDDWKEHKRDVRNNIEPQRMKFAVEKLSKINGVGIIEGYSDKIVVRVDGYSIDFYPYSGWYCGLKPIGHIKGRGIFNLVNVIKERKWKKQS